MVFKQSIRWVTTVADSPEVAATALSTPNISAHAYAHFEEKECETHD
jgi:hypothetical protein